MIESLNQHKMIGRLKRGLKRNKRGNPEGGREKLREGANSILQTNLKGLAQPRNYFPLYLSGILKTKATANRQSNWLVVVNFVFLFPFKILSCFPKHRNLSRRGMQDFISPEKVAIASETPWNQGVKPSIDPKIVDSESKWK